MNKWQKNRKTVSLGEKASYQKNWMWLLFHFEVALIMMLENGLDGLWVRKRPSFCPLEKGSRLGDEEDSWQMVTAASCFPSVPVVVRVVLASFS